MRDLKLELDRLEEKLKEAYKEIGRLEYELARERAMNNPFCGTTVVSTSDSSMENVPKPKGGKE